jgi:hypothetical protein
VSFRKVDVVAAWLACCGFFIGGLILGWLLAHVGH